MAKAAAIGAIPTGGRSGATGKENALAIAGNIHGFPKNLREFVRVVRGVLGDNTKAFDTNSKNV